MNNTIFIKESFIKALISSINNIEEAKNVFKNEVPQGVLYNLVNRAQYLKETCQALNSNEQKLISISGFQGAGKTEFINTLMLALEENTLNFYYECSPVTHLDDIILSLFNYLKKIAIKNPEYKRAFKISNSQSIDERLMNYIKNINRPLLIVIDGFKNPIHDIPDEEQKELIHFLEFLSSFSEIKIIISGGNARISSLKIEPFEIRLGGLDEPEANKLLKNNGITETESGFQQIFQVTRGYPENLLWFSSAVNGLKISSFDLMQEYYAKEQKSFEEFIYKKIYQTIPDEFLKTLYFLAAIRHSISIDILKKLNFDSEISDRIDYLTSKMMLTQNREAFYIKTSLKNTIYLNFSADEKKQIHRYLYEIYSEQISKKLEERIFPISRKLLYSEQYYHYMCLINYGDKSLTDLKSITLSNLKPDFKYLYTNITDSLFTGSDEHEHTSSFAEKENKTAVILNDKQDFENPIINSLQASANDNIELSEEEKALLAEENDLIEHSDVAPEKLTEQNSRCFVQDDSEFQKEKKPQADKKTGLNKK